MPSPTPSTADLDYPERHQLDDEADEVASWSPAMAGCLVSLGLAAVIVAAAVLGGARG